MTTTATIPTPRVRMVVDVQLTDMTEGEADQLFGEIKAAIEDLLAKRQRAQPDVILDVQVDADDPWLISTPED